MRDVMIRRDGRVEIYGDQMSENEAAEWLRSRGHAGLVLWMRQECAKGRKFSRGRNLPYFDADGVEINR